MINEMMVHFKLGDKCDKNEMINMTQAWDKEKSLCPQRKCNPCSHEHRAGAVYTELRELMGSEAIQLSSYVISFLCIFSLSHARDHFIFTTQFLIQEVYELAGKFSLIWLVGCRLFVGIPLDSCKRRCYKNGAKV